MQLGTLTWPEVAALPRDIVVVFPFGALEQHSHHLPLMTDALIVSALAERLEQARSERVLLAPTMWLGASEDHLMFPGTLDSGLRIHIYTVMELAASLARHDFAKFLMLNGHGGNVETIQIANRLLKAKFTEATFACANYWQTAEAEIAALLETQRGLGHACELETSLLLATHPELVRFERAEPDGVKLPPALRGVRVARNFAERTQHGGFGDPTAASGEKGERLLAAIVARLVEVVDAL